MVTAFYDSYWVVGINNNTSFLNVPVTYSDVNRKIVYVCQSIVYVRQNSQAYEKAIILLSARNIYKCFR